MSNINTAHFLEEKFIPAKDLKQSYLVFGFFYTLILDDNVEAECRSVLEIISHNAMPDEADDITNLKPDAVMIMMNPGSSKPLADVNNRIKADKIGSIKTSLVKAKPDTTQYQVMRIMKAKGWNHVRVLNLSDLRNPKSGIFFNEYMNLEKNENGTLHSIFAEARSKELYSRLNRKKGAPIVCAWGLSNKLDILINRCLDQLPEKKELYGLIEEGNKYRHPLPTLQKQKIKWINDILTQL